MKIVVLKATKTSFKRKSKVSFRCSKWNVYLFHWQPVIATTTILTGSGYGNWRHFLLWHCRYSASLSPFTVETPRWLTHAEHIFIHTTSNAARPNLSRGSQKPIQLFRTISNGLQRRWVAKVISGLPGQRLSHWVRAFESFFRKVVPTIYDSVRLRCWRVHAAALLLLSSTIDVQYEGKVKSAV